VSNTNKNGRAPLTLLGVKVVYTDAWASMGQEEERQEREKIFRPFQVNPKLMERQHKPVIFMHCLPLVRRKGD